jgi:hypothetical protein
MLDLQIIEDEIKELESGETSYKTCERLAWLYTVKNYYQPQSVAQKASDDLAEVSGDSEFMQAVEGLPVSQIMEVIDNHMEAIKVVCPKEYESVVNKIRALR